MMTEDGRLAGFGGGESSGSFARELADRVLKPFFPILPEEGAEPGAAWSDTVDTRMMANGLDNNIQLISDHSAVEWTRFAGERALYILTFTEYSFSGAGIQAGRSFILEGTGRRYIHRYLSETGRYLGLVSADSSAGEARITDMEMVIPIYQTRVDSLAIR
jgi:hypothetical protein